jgi:aminoglycoside 3-N-acetyltransferase I
MKLTGSKINIKRIDKKDILLTSKLIHLFNNVFETGNIKTPKTVYIEKLLANPNFIAFVALDKNEVVGGLTAYELPMYYSESSEMFIYDIAIKQEHQREEIGKGFITALQEHCKKKGIKEMFVAANIEDTHALKFYTAIGGISEKVVHFNFNTWK